MIIIFRLNNVQWYPFRAYIQENTHNNNRINCNKSSDQLENDTFKKLITQEPKVIYKGRAMPLRKKELFFRRQSSDWHWAPRGGGVKALIALLLLILLSFYFAAFLTRFAFYSLYWRSNFCDEHENVFIHCRSLI